MNFEVIKRLFGAILLFYLLSATDSLGQIHVGPKVGIQAYMPIYKDAIMYPNISPSPGLGYAAGIAFDYDANKLFSFYSELTYSRRGKYLSGGIKDEFENKARYHYIELPILARLTFEENIKGRVFSWYLNGGGSINYWVSGNGNLTSFEFDETNVVVLDYKIKFKPKTDNTIDDEYILYMEEPNRLQVGLVIGGGMLFSNPISPHKDLIMIDLRYTFRHSWLGRDYEVDVGLDEYYEDFRTMEHILSLSVGYLFEYNIGERRKGKSSKGQKIKTKKVGGTEKKKKDNYKRRKN